MHSDNGLQFVVKAEAFGNKALIERVSNALSLTSSPLTSIVLGIVLEAWVG